MKAVVCLVGVVVAKEKGSDRSVININNQCGCCGGGKKGSKDGLIAFSMSTSKNFSPSTTTIIPLEDEIFNEGGHFHTNDNTFYTPEDGVYSFTFSAVAMQNKLLSLHLYRQKGTNPKDQIARACDYNGPGTGNASGGSGGSIIVRLEKDDKISLWLYGGMGVFGHATDVYSRSTLFSGMKVSD